MQTHLLTQQPTPRQPTSPRRARGTRAAAVLGTAALTAGMLAVGAPAALAHDRLVSSDPESGATLEAAPAQAVLTFSAEVQDVGTVAELHDATGTTISEDPSAVQGREVVLPLPAGLGDGDYELVYRVTSSDGHPISGAVPFTLDVADQPADPVRTSPAPESPVPTTSAPATPPPTSTAQPSEEPTGALAQRPVSAQESGTPWGVVVGVVAALVVLGLLAALLLRRRGSRTS